eukprot:2001819-Prymnesium_polylepis.1
MPFCVVARGSGYNTIAFMSDAMNGRSAARCRNTIVRENDTFLLISPSLGCGTPRCAGAALAAQLLCAFSTLERIGVLTRRVTRRRPDWHVPCTVRGCAALRCPRPAAGSH